ncbi:unnamed protein product [Blepharisma stoltei]|uniref:RNA-dependent RNA polymerase n=1 Tax=Blepharisma stoltei TaxID=1481888 RepID=A0AAU9JPQ6_9CILI|nr:unnamed protein product [Blepharisma stoltei]
MVQVIERMIRGYPKEWDSLDLRDFLVRFGLILRIRTNEKGFSFITFHAEKVREEISESQIETTNFRLLLDPPQKPENYKFDDIVPNLIYNRLDIGIPKWEGNSYKFVILDSYALPCLSFISLQKRKLDIRIIKSGIKYRVLITLKHIIEYSCMNAAGGFRAFIRCIRPPRLYKLNPRSKKFPIWTLGIQEPSWVRIENFFDGFEDLLSFQIKNICFQFTIFSQLETGLLEALATAVVTTPNYPTPVPSPRNLITSHEINSLQVSFQTKFMLYSILSLCYISLFELTRDFLSNLASLNQPKVVDTLKWIINSQRNFAIRSIPQFEELFNEVYCENTEFPVKIAEGYETINRLLITPTTFYALAGEPELSNRVTRRYFYEDKENLLRVSFTDENLNKILPYPDDLKKRVESLLACLNFAGKSYQVLGFSASQLKEHSAWMLHQTEEVNGEKIRKKLGDFSQIDCPGKYVARVGQSFSASRFMMTLAEDQIIRIKDIKTENKKYTFSDGIGKVSQDLVTAINTLAGCRACAFQIRLGGCKGVIALDDTLTGSVVYLRPSQVKFESKIRDLELLNPAEFRFGYLNRQLIMLLSTLGVPDSTFDILQEEMLETLRSDLKSYIEYIRGVSRGNLTVQCLERLMDYPREPIFGELKELLITRSLEELKKKQRIWIRKSGCLMGVLDEKGLLNYGEVFLQTQEGGIVEGLVVVAKNPCLHPGDIRILMAVNHPELHHLYHVVVFPQKGERPHTNECSGSDLDGDLYFITWDIRLIPPHYAHPMEYDTAKPKKEPGPYDFTTLIYFFSLFIANDRLGQIDNAHLALADASKNYAFDEKCIELCELHSVAVDFAKTGNTVTIPKELQPQAFPDFMEKKDMNYYQSQKILGKLYRKIVELPKESIPGINQKLIVEGYKREKGNAKEIFARYKRDLQILLDQYGIRTEIEMLIAQPVTMSKYHKKRKRQEEMREILTYLSNKIVEKYREIFEQKASMELASAIYKIAHKNNPPYRLFPWVVCGDYLFNALSS